jgi:hypothetical protein
MEKNYVNNGIRSGGMTVEKQQGMKVLVWTYPCLCHWHDGLGADLSPSVSFKDQYIVRPRAMLNACLTLGWPDKTIRP